MDSVLEIIVPQAGILNNEENPAIDSNRVKASVVIAGSTDFWGARSTMWPIKLVQKWWFALTATQKTSNDEEEGGKQTSAAQGGSGEMGSGGPRDPDLTRIRTKIARMEEAIEHLIQVLDDKKKRTVNDGTRILAHKVKSAFVSIKRVLQGRKTNSKLAAVNQRVQQHNSIRTELFQAPGGTV